jgi:hypothetical protein
MRFIHDIKCPNSGTLYQLAWSIAAQNMPSEDFQMCGLVALWDESTLRSFPAMLYLSKGFGRAALVFWRLLAVVGLALAACKPAPETPTPLPICIPSNTKIDEASGYPEIEFPASEGTLWALLFARDGEFRAGTRARILWKMTDGRGDIHLTAVDERRTLIRPEYGPVSRQLRSAWKHDGQEWAAEFTFPRAGCWRILVSRWLLDTDPPVTGQIEIQVTP